MNKSSISFLYSSLNGTQMVGFSYARTHSGRYTEKKLSLNICRRHLLQGSLKNVWSEFLKKSKLTLEFFWNFAVGYFSDKILTREVDEYHPNISRNWISKIFSCSFQIPIIFSNLNYNCSKMYYISEISSKKFKKNCIS